jgi:sugar phosphate isomerase/epimerase
MLRFPIAIQLYSVREELEADFEGTLQVLREMGYDGIEMVGMYGRTPTEIMEICAKYELELISMHISVDEVMNWSKAQLVEYKEMGCKQVVLCYLPPAYRYGTECYPILMSKLREMGEYGQEIGLLVAYHNHDFEFLKADDKYVLDMLYEEISEEILKAELDTCWIHVGGEKPADYIRKYAKRMLAVHLKDYRPSDDGLEICMCPIGQGVLDFQDILKASEEAGASWMVVEQDFPSRGATPLECARMSIEYLKSLLKEAIEK